MSIVTSARSPTARRSHRIDDVARREMRAEYWRRRGAVGHRSAMAYVTIVLVLGLVGSDVLGLVARLRDRA